MGQVRYQYLKLRSATRSLVETLQKLGVPRRRSARTPLPPQLKIGPTSSDRPAWLYLHHFTM